MTVRKIIQYSLFLVLAGVLLYFSFRGVHWNDFIIGLKSANYIWIATSMCLGTFSAWVRGVRWRLLIQGLGFHVKKRQAYDAVNIAYLTNFALPRAGELARCGALAKATGAPFDALLGTVVLERSFDVFCLLLILAGVISLQWELFGGFMRTQVWAPVAHFLNGQSWYLFLVVLLIAALILFLVILYRRHLVKFVLFEKFYSLALGVLKGLKSGFSMPQKLPFIGLTILLWFCYWAMCRATLWAFPATAGLNTLDAVFLMVVGSLGWVVPVQGGIGAYHFIVSLALSSVYGIAQTQGVIFATISHESQAVTMLILGASSFIRMSLYTQKKHV